MSDAPPVLARVVRDDVVESVHRGHLVVADAAGTVRAAIGDPALAIYARSALKPFQALAVLDLLAESGLGLDARGLAIACASHTGSTDQQIEAARLLAVAGLDETALRCPAALPVDLYTLLDQRGPTSLAHNCSGKHAAFLFAQTAAGDAPERYLDGGTRLQRRVAERLADVAGGPPQGPGVDGCGAPAWRLPLGALATAFARLAGGHGRLGRVRAAMTSHPELVGGGDCADTELMGIGPAVIAKRGAEAVLGAGWRGAGGPLGIVVKIADGGARATRPTVGAALRALGGHVPDEIVLPPVLGGGRPRGRIEPDPAIAETVARA